MPCVFEPRSDPVRPICESDGALGVPRGQQKQALEVGLGFSTRPMIYVAIRPSILARQKLAHNY